MTARELPVLTKNLQRNRQHGDFALGTLTSITVWHDYICPWCWVALFQAKRLQAQFGVTFDWRGCELIPPGMEGPPDPTANAEGKISQEKKPDSEPNKPKDRFALFLEAEGVELATPRPQFTRSHKALLGTEFAREHGDVDAFIEGVYRAYWERHENIGSTEVLQQIAAQAGMDAAEFGRSIEAEQYAERILPFDDEAYAYSVRHAPTFFFGGAERLAEAHYDDLARATERFLLRAERIRTARGIEG